jgi:YHS domain-containing protein
MNDKKAKAADGQKCINCGRPVSQDKTQHQLVYYSQRFYLCSSDCVKEFIKRYEEMGR